MPRPTFRRYPLLGLLTATVALTATSAAPAEDLSTSSGAQLYRQYCASCHGRGGEGDGPVASFFKLAPPDLTEIAKRNRGTFPTDWVRRVVDGSSSIGQHGSREMPVWGLQFSMTAPGPVEGKAVTEAAIARLVEHLRSIQKAPAQQQ